MTLQASRQAHRMCRVATALVAVALTASCGSGSESGPEASPEPTFEYQDSYSVDELAQALPSSDNFEFATDEEPSYLCPSEKDAERCGDFALVHLDVAMAGPDGSRPELSGSLRLNAIPIESEQAFADHVAANEKTLRQYEGDFDFDAVGDENSYTPGAEGQGTLEPATISGWTGQGFNRELQRRGVDGVEFGERYVEVGYFLTHGTTSVTAECSFAAGEGVVPIAEECARKLATEYLERLAL